MQFATKQDLIHIIGLGLTYEDQALFWRIEAQGQVLKHQDNRYLSFLVKEPIEHIIELQKAVEQFVQVDKIMYAPSSVFGVIKLKAAVAQQALSSIRFQGGLLVQDLPVELQLLSSAEEHLYDLAPSKSKPANPIMNKKTKKTRGISKKPNRKVLKQKQKKNLDHMLAALAAM